jgi:DNA (cytosine-5)-methyltransferase 1
MTGREPAIIHAKVGLNGSCVPCELDTAFLKRKRRPTAPDDQSPVRVVDLFAGCGGMSVGLFEAARRSARRLKVTLAVDLDARALKVLRTNLPGTTTKAADLSDLFHGQPGEELTEQESELRSKVGSVDILVGGPPCQGHSDLNNHTRRSDPKNVLYLRMARAAEVLRPAFVVIENVVAVQWDTGGVISKTRDALQRSGYAVAGGVIDLARVGVPQRRRRYLMLASRAAQLDPRAILTQLNTTLPDHGPRTVEWAIGDLRSRSGSTAYDTAARATKKNTRRIKYLFEHDVFNLPNSRRPKCHRKGGHSYLSVYGRLHPDLPAQTITTGFGSMGQGRFVHPSQRRTITPHEAARLQTFPDWFRFGKDTPRTALARMIGNAVPPLLTVVLGSLVIHGLVTDATKSPEDHKQ